MTTGIQWTDETWNPIRGCSRVSEGCRNCYAEAIAARFSGPGLAYEGLARRRPNGEPQWTGVVRVVEEHMLDPIRWRVARRIFVNSMSDLFHEKVDVDTIARVWAVMALAPRHTYQILTKRPKRMREVLLDPTFYDRVLSQADAIRADRRRDAIGFELTSYSVSNPRDGSFYPQVWLGVSVENQAAADERIPLLLRTPAAIRFLSCEPLLGDIDLTRVNQEDSAFGLDALTGKEYYPRSVRSGLFAKLDWVIVGGESGRNARPFELAWARSIIAQCGTAGVAVFVKQIGQYPTEDAAATFPVPIDLRDSHGGDMAEWPEDLRIRAFPSTSGARP